MGNGADEPHAFISYVREDAQDADRLQRFLEGAGIKVWRDTKDLWPGEDWRLNIRQAITNNALVFIACFSDNSAARATSFQNEELVTAVDEFRKRSPGQTWLIPVRFSDCALPQFDLGAGRTLDSLQRVDLWGDAWDGGTGRLLTSVLRAFEALNPAQAGKVLATPPREAPAEYVKARLLDDARQIELDDYLARLTDRVIADLLDADIFPAQSGRVADTPDGFRFLVAQTNEYFNRVTDLLDALSRAADGGGRSTRFCGAAPRASCHHRTEGIRQQSARRPTTLSNPRAVVCLDTGGAQPRELPSAEGSSNRRASATRR
ncbi:MAG: toll/interleukin-1 receptor domain-containing protein [Actinomycetota bacterium]|nr:toll/interleukin-1 receptor domain-containing protein [Actinomycetota bacterium]